MTGIVLATIGVALAVTYRVAFEVRKDALAERAASRAALVEAIWRGTGDPDETLQILTAAQRRAPTFGRTGEIAIARRDGDAVLFLFRREGEHGLSPSRLAGPAEVALPMRRALAGHSGVVVARDYRNREVLAAYRPIPALGWGLGAKMELAEVRAPFWRALGVTVAAAFLLVTAGLVVFSRVFDPMVRQLERSEARYRELFDRVPVGLYRTSPDGRFLDANPALASLLGFRDPAELAPISAASLYVRPEDRERWRQRLEGQDAIAGEEVELRRPDGSSVWIRHTTRAHRAADGTVIAYDGAAEDVTAQRRASESLQERERLLDTVLESLPVGVWIADADGTIRRGNPASRQIWQGARYVPPAEYAVYRGWWRRTGEPIAPEQWSLARAIRDGESSTDEEIEIECFDGTRKVILNSGVPLRDGDGRVVGAIATNLDITERVRAEDRLAEVRRELERSNAELQQFAYVASHDLQEPLRMVVSYLQLLERRLGADLDERSRTFLDYAVDGGRRMQRLIHDLLELSRVQTRGRPFEPVDLDAAMARVRDDLALAVSESGGSVTWAGLPVVMADRAQMAQLLQNLVANALKFRGEEPPRVVVTARRAPGGWQLSVCDNGIGIAPEHHARIFEVFQRLHGRREYPGTGIGLAICKRIVERHGGLLWVESRAACGATFHLTLSDQPAVSALLSDPPETTHAC